MKSTQICAIPWNVSAEIVDTGTLKMYDFINIK